MEHYQLISLYGYTRLPPMFHLLHLLCVMARFSAVSHATLMTSRSSRGLLLLLHTPARLTTAVWYSKCCMRKDYIYSQVGFKKKMQQAQRVRLCSINGFYLFCFGFFFCWFCFHILDVSLHVTSLYFIQNDSGSIWWQNLHVLRIKNAFRPSFTN